MTYPTWLRHVRQLLGREGLFPADFAGWNWARLCADGCTPEEAAETALIAAGLADDETAAILPASGIISGQTQFQKTLK